MAPNCCRAQFDPSARIGCRTPLSAWIEVELRTSLAHRGAQNASNRGYAMRLLKDDIQSYPADACSWLIGRLSL